MLVYVYVLLSEKDKRFYVGMTDNLNRRMDEHASGKVKSTYYRRPLSLLLYEVYSLKEIARKREKFLKSSDGREDLRKRFGDIDLAVVSIRKV